MRQRRGRTHGRPDKPRRTEGAAVAPLKKARRLDLDLPVTEPLAPEEIAEMNEHLAFLRQFKVHLKLSLNAAEDLLINGAKAPSDRGLAKHLLSKIDRKLVERTLAREALKNDPPLRARFLAGVVRLNPEISVLLWYLEALSAVADKRDAAAAFWLTIDRIDFTQTSPAQMVTLVEVIQQTFVDHDRAQALFGLLASDSFGAALDRALPSLPRETRELFLPLRAAHSVVMRGERFPTDESALDLVHRGIAMWISAPDRVVRSYPLEVRKRLAEITVQEIDLAGGAEVPRSLIDSLPHQDPAYARLALARAEQLLAAHDDQGARALFSQIAQAHPNLTRAVRRHEAMSWPRVGRVTIAPASQGEGIDPARLLEAFWLDGSTFAWARLGPPEQAGRLTTEAQLQANLMLPGVLPALAHGLANDGKVFVVIAAGGRPIERAWVERLSLPEVLIFALEGLRILRAVASSGVELPDSQLRRFVLERGGPHGLRLANLDGAKRVDPSAAAIAHGTLARKFATDVFSTGGALRRDLPPAVKAKLRGAVPLPVLGRTLAEQAARAV